MPFNYDSLQALGTIDREHGVLVGACALRLDRLTGLGRGFDGGCALLCILVSYEFWRQIDCLALSRQTLLAIACQSAYLSRSRSPSLARRLATSSQRSLRCISNPCSRGKVCVNLFLRGHGELFKESRPTIKKMRFPHPSRCSLTFSSLPPSPPAALSPRLRRPFPCSLPPLPPSRSSSVPFFLRSPRRSFTTVAAEDILSKSIIIVCKFPSWATGEAQHGYRSVNLACLLCSSNLQPVSVICGLWSVISGSAVPVRERHNQIEDRTSAPPPGRA